MVVGMLFIERLGSDGPSLSKKKKKSIMEVEKK
jgi:hypothetical protein